MSKLNPEQRALLNGAHRQLYLFWSDVIEKHTEPKYFLTEKQISFLFSAIFAIRDGETLTQERSDACNDIVFKYWKAKNKGGRKNVS